MTGTSQNQNRPNIIKIVLIVILLILIVWFAYKYFVLKQKASERQVSNLIPVVYNNPVDYKYLPEGMPNDLPFEKDAVILQNYTASLGNGRLQSTRAYISNQNMQTSFEGFYDYLSKDGWQIFSQKNDANLKAIFSKKTIQEISVIISRNTVNSQVTITVNSIQNVVSTIATPSQSADEPLQITDLKEAIQKQSVIIFQGFTSDQIVVTHDLPDPLNIFLPVNILKKDIITQYNKNNATLYYYVSGGYMVPNTTIVKEQAQIRNIATTNGWKELSSFSGNIASFTEVEKQVEGKLYQVRINFLTDGEENIKIGVQAKITNMY